jgi:hypothetical protein
MNDSMWVTGYLPDGFKVSLTLLLTAERDVQFWMNYVRSQGILPREPGVAAGEQSQDITAILRMGKVNEDGTESDILCLYPDRFNFAFLKVYLNTETDRTLASAALGVKVDQLLVFPGTAALERGKNPKIDQQYVVATPQPVKVIYMDNPAYNPDEPDATKRKPKRKFVRWANQPAARPPQAANDATAQTETKSAAPKYDRAALLELITPFYNHPNHARASLDKLLNHTDTECQEWWIPADSSTIAAAYGVLLYKAANTESIAMNRVGVLKALGVERFNEWNKQYVTDADALEAAWATLQAAAVGEF